MVRVRTVVRVRLGRRAMHLDEAQAPPSSPSRLHRRRRYHHCWGEWVARARVEWRGACGRCLVHFQLVGARQYGIELSSWRGSMASTLTRSMPPSSAGECEHSGCRCWQRWPPKAMLDRRAVLARIGVRIANADPPHGPPRGQTAARAPWTIRFAVGGRCRFEHVWPLISQVAEEMLAQEYARFSLCRCDI